METPPQVSPLPSTPVGGAITAEVHETPSAAIGPNPNVTKVIVAIHGVGDQLSFATLQSVVNQFCAYYNEPLAVPLGHFHTALDEKEEVAAPPYCLGAPYPDHPFQKLAFAEVYWAKIPRALVGEEHTLEEAKEWARTIVERLRLRWQQTGKGGACQDEDFLRIKDLLTEMIQTLAVLERLCFLAERAGLFSFDLRRLLDDYLGDVQVVAEFKSQRDKILAAFTRTLQRVQNDYPKAEIYIIAHSEGTVVAFLGLLAALRNKEGNEWVNNVHGLMTFGSPIDKHLILWPELFVAADPNERLQEQRQIEWPKGRKKIQWRNYYDRGDPIGFALDDAQNWLKDNHLSHVFHFEKDNDIGFTRYPFPGKAHVDYWQDEEVFGHFIRTVVNHNQHHRDPDTTARFATPPGDIQWKKWLSYGLPYVGVLAVLFVAVYILFKAIAGYTDPKGEVYENDVKIFQDVADITLLLFGVTVATRIPRITWSRQWRAGAVGIFLILAVFCFWYLPLESACEKELRTLVMQKTAISLPVGIIRPLVATIIMLLALWMSARKPAWGLAPLLVLGTAAMLGFVVRQYFHNAQDPAPLWPIFPATAAFFYLWWLAALTFDLVFVWHVQIRQEQALIHMDRMVKSKARRTGKPVTAGPTVPHIS